MGDAADAVRRFYEAFNRNDWDAMNELMTDDFENTDPTGTLHGRDAFRRFIDGFKTAMPDAKLTANRIIEGDGVSATEGSFSGTFTGPLRTPNGELPPSGKAFDLPFAEVNEVEGGRIRRHTVYYDQVSFMAALGVQQPG
jgi:steroid delta-isomerase-like uncharacterized protein